MSLLAARGLAVTISGKEVCRDFDWRLQAGECWGLLGANGIGKTTLLYTLAGLRAPLAGTVTLGEIPVSQWPLRRLARERGLLFQDSHDTFPATVLETVLAGRYPHLDEFAWDSETDRQSARAALAEVGLGTLANRPLQSLSAGERRRVAIAALLAQEPKVWLLDEPANHLDLHFQVRMIELIISRAVAGGGGLVMVLHDLNLAARFCSHVLLLFGGGQSRAGPAEVVLARDNLERLYQHPLRIIESQGQRVYLPG